MMQRVLVANRGEIARRVFATCRRLGIATAAVFSDVDADAAFVAEADIACRLPGSSATQTYLQVDLILDAAQRMGADAVHPGYGFLSENAGFARAVQNAGLVWIGPEPDVIEAMGSKIKAKELMAAAGVPVLSRIDPDTVTDDEFPVLIKASAGGGGRGMRVVYTRSELASELTLARAEAASAFGDETVFCERYLPTGHHIEVQVLADKHGTIWTVGERECSLQRHHQKVIEEAPSPLVERVTGMRARLMSAAYTAAETIGYDNAGTVEFLSDADGNFFFLEMNTRLQVEHPVTEATTGLDLVEWQLRIADGHKLTDAPPARHGYSIEARLYAEDPAAGWQPQTGLLHEFAVAGAPFENAPLRLDSGFGSGNMVSSYYDAMLAKVISTASSRQTAAARLAQALTHAQIHGVKTNRDLLVRTLLHSDFLSGNTDTSFFEAHGGPTVLGAGLAHDPQLFALAAALAQADAQRPLVDVPIGWRNVYSQPQQRRYRSGECEFEVSYYFGRDGMHSTTHPQWQVVSLGNEIILENQGLTQRFQVHCYPDLICVDSASGSMQFEPLPRFLDPVEKLAPGSLRAPMPGTVTRIEARVGDRVSAGEPLLWLEAMKMQHHISAPVDGVLTELYPEVGQQVETGMVLALVQTDEKG